MSDNTSVMYDIAIVGGGPGGMQAAHRLAQAGFAVVVFEEHTAAGDPVHCTGILAAEAFEEFDVPRSAFLNSLTTVQFFGPSGAAIEYSTPEVEAIVIDRRAFDQALSERAERAGASVQVGQRITDVQIADHGVTLTTSTDRRIDARACVLACGANYALQKRLGLGMPAMHLQSAQLELPAAEPGYVEVHFGSEVAPKGFAWAVPVSRGNGTFARIGLMCERDAREYFDRFLARISPRWKTGAFDCLDGGLAPRTKMLPLGPIEKTYATRVLAIGDAAGLVKATTGGGIYYSLLSGTHRGRDADRRVSPGRPERSVTRGLRRPLARAARRRIFRADEPAAHREPAFRRGNRRPLRAGSNRRHHAARAPNRPLQQTSRLDRLSAEPSARPTRVDATSPGMGRTRLTDYGPIESRPASRGAVRRPIPLVLLTVTLLVIAWGALAFGAVYPWAYTPLAIGCGVTGLLALVFGRRGRPPMAVMATSLACLGLVIALQLAPLAPSTVARVSPAAQTLESRHRQTYGVLSPLGAESTPDDRQQSLSIDPDRTLVGLSLFAALALFCLGTARLLSRTGASLIGRPLVAFGMALAIFGIVSSTLTATVNDPLIYGFWKPQFSAHPFGPFVNPNHFAGWVLMVFPLALALFYDAFQRTIDEIRGRENRMAFVSSPHFGAIMIYGLAAAVMGVSLAMTRSRSGIGALASASTLIAWVVLRRQKGAKAKAAVLASFLTVMIGTAAWAGLDTVTEKFVISGDGQGLGAQSGRMAAWTDTIRIIRDFPLAGTGLNTYGTAMTVYQTGIRQLHFQEAHNDYLQIAAEGGLLVGLPALVALAIFARDVRRRFREAPKEGTTYWLRVGAVIGLVAIGLQSIFEFSLQMPGNAALFAVLAAIAMHQSPNLRPASH